MPQGAKRLAHQEAASLYKQELAERIAKAFKQYNADVRSGQEIGQADLGRLVATKIGKPTAITQASVSAWMNTANPSSPDNLTLRAIAEVLNVDLMWLIYGAAQD